MSNATDYLESAIGDSLFLGVAFPTPTNWTIHLYSARPNEAGSGGIEIPMSSNGYLPVNFPPGAGNWQKNASQDLDGNTVYSNAIPVIFSVVLQPWTNINFCVLKNHNGRECYVMPLPPMTINTGDQVVFLAGQLEFPIG